MDEEDLEWAEWRGDEIHRNLAREIRRLRAIGPAAMDGHSKAETEELMRRLKLAHDAADKYQWRALNAEIESRRLSQELATQSELSRNADSR